MPQTFSDRTLLLGILAWRLDFISADQLLAAIAAWIGDKARSLGDILVEQSALTPEGRELLESLADAHIKAHRFDAKLSLASLRPLGAMAERLKQLDDDELSASLGPLGDTALSTVPPQATAAPATAEAETAAPTTAASLPEAADLRPGSSVSRFVILREHARGGLGKVSIARDQELNREVALKEIRPELAHDAASRRRFVREAEITGGLEHPGLAPVYGLGTFADGRPFYAMRLIRGENLSAAIKRFHGKAGPTRRGDEVDESPGAGRASDGGEKHLELRRLLDRFIDVCRTMHYAHSRGVIHRDLKPANIMLGRYGETLVVDWGLAKATGRDDAASQAAQADGAQVRDASIRNVSLQDDEPLLRPSSGDDRATEQGATVGTPAYMSPEQAAGRLTELTAASDIYSLGATLYCILTGETPVKRPSVGEVIKAVCRGDFAAPRRLNPAVPRQLEAVCLKAMALEPAARYDSAAVLAEEIERFLADEPVSAWPEPAAVRARRWVARHRALASGGAAAALVALVGLTAGLFVVSGLNSKLEAANLNLIAANDAESQAHERTRGAQGRTRRAFDIVTDDVIVGLLGRGNQYQLGPHEREFLRKVLGFYQEFAASQGDTPQAQHDRAHGYLRVGFLRQRLGELTAAEAAYDDALALAERLVAESPEAGSYQEVLARVQSHRGTLLETTSRPQEAEAAYRASLAIHQRLPAELRRANRVGLARDGNNLGNVLRDASRHRDAEAAYDDALAELQTLAAEFPGVADHRKDLAMVHNNRGMLLDKMNRPHDAETAYREALNLLKKLSADAPGVAAYRHSMVLSLQNQGHVLGDLGRPGDAEAAYREALAVARQLAADFPTVPDYRHGLAATHAALAGHYRDSGKAADAEAAFRDAVAVLKRLTTDFPAVPSYRESLAVYYNGLGILLRENGRMPEAEAAYRAALALQEQLAAEVPANPGYRQELARVHHNLGALLYFLGRHDDAHSAYHEALALRQKLAAEFPQAPAHRRDIAKSHETLALLLAAMARPKEAEAAYREAVALRNEVAAGSPKVASYRHELASCHHSLSQFLSDQDRAEEADTACRAALAVWQALAAEFPAAPDYATNAAAMLVSLARRKNATKDHLAAKELLEQARPYHGRALAAGPKHRTYRLGLRDNQVEMCAALMGLGDRAALVQEAEALARFGADPANDLYQGACFIAICGRLAGQDPTLPEAKKRELMQQYADKAMAALSEAVAAGFKNTEAIKKARALAPLREREDFQRLLKGLESKDATPPKTM